MSDSIVVGVLEPGASVNPQTYGRRRGLAVLGRHPAAAKMERIERKCEKWSHPGWSGTHTLDGIPVEPLYISSTELTEFGC